MAQVVSVSVPDELFARWKQSDLSISPSSLFHMALETHLDSKSQYIHHWSLRALKAEKKLNIIKEFINHDSK
mgnify:CR=1 FL=1|tara:strand:+ start:264 stop:479 length:216 start_codon:yes stop_codon:yes gene_type:complete